ncbi:MAG: HPF/RaiA family ribosome-associated protein [Gemmatimonadales bacterium]|jgi:ribosomal subunit interface protein
MRTTVTVRHCEIPDELRDRAQTLIEKTAKAAHRPQRAEIVFDVDHGQKVVEIQLYLPRGQVKVATAEADDFRTALDRAMAKVRNQLDKISSRPARRSS